jgi:hypothetical protein
VRCWLKFDDGIRSRRRSSDGDDQIRVGKTCILLPRGCFGRGLRQPIVKCATAGYSQRAACGAAGFDVTASGGATGCVGSRPAVRIDSAVESARSEQRFGARD